MDAQTLKRRREQAGLTQGDLEEITGIARPNISGMETGQRPIGDEMRERLEAALSEREAELEAMRAEFAAAIERKNRNPKRAGELAKLNAANAEKSTQVYRTDDLRLDPRQSKQRAQTARQRALKPRKSA